MPPDASLSFPAADEVVDVSVGGGTAGTQLWWTQVPALPGHRLGVVGGFHASDAAAAAAVLEASAGRLARAGCSLAVGPMDGTTWRSYRFVSEAGSEPPFLFEPVHPPDWPAWWRAAGFTALASYTSTLARDLATRDPRVPALAGRLERAGVRLRPLDLSRIDAELGAIHDVSVEAFRDNFLYTPLSRESFLAQYRAVIPHVRPELVLLAEQAGRVVGYVFMFPDLLEAKRGARVTTAIVKTLAVRPGRAFAGLGAWLLDRAHAEAHRLGFSRAVHAMMHEANVSRNLSARTAVILRRYLLLARPLSR